MYKPEQWNHRAPPEQHQGDDWPKLEKPAKVGATHFYSGVSTRMVVEAAQRQWEYSQNPLIEADRLERFQNFMHRLHHGGPATAGVTPPEGWKLVPIRPTAEMLKAVDDDADDQHLARGRAFSAWVSMIDAAPAAPLQPQPTEDQPQ